MKVSSTLVQLFQQVIIDNKMNDPSDIINIYQSDI